MNDRFTQRLPRVLAYHKVTSFEFGGTWLPPRRFAGHLDALLRDGHRFVDETAFLDALEGRRAAGPGEILLTFDDGYRCLLDAAIPALEARGIPALLFLVSDYVGLENRWELRLPGRRFAHLSWDEIADLARRGFAFGSHGTAHRDLTRLAPAALRDELVRSKAAIEDRLGAPVRSFSYPFGRVSDASRREAERAGYRAAFTLYPRLRRDAGGRFELRRDGVYVIDTAGCVRRKLGRGAGYALENVKGRAINACAVLTPLLTGGSGRARTPYRPAPPDR